LISKLGFIIRLKTEISASPYLGKSPPKVSVAQSVWIKSRMNEEAHYLPHLRRNPHRFPMSPIKVQDMRAACLSKFFHLL